MTTAPKKRINKGRETEAAQCLGRVIFELEVMVCDYFPDEDLAPNKNQWVDELFDAKKHLENVQAELEELAERQSATK